MGFWRPLDCLLIVMGLTAIRQYKSKDDVIPDLHGLLLCGVIGLLLSLGPSITDSVSNPIYQLFSLLPGMWRFAKPEDIPFHPICCGWSTLVKKTMVRLDMGGDGRIVCSRSVLVTGIPIFDSVHIRNAAFLNY